MKKISILIISVFFICACKSKDKVEVKKNKIPTNVLDSLYSINKQYPLNDVRRYGVEPNKGIGEHPKLKKDKLEVLLDIAENGQDLIFPEGSYSRTLAIKNRENIKLQFNNAIFTGSIIVQNSNDVELLGKVTSLIQFYTREAKDVTLDELVLATDTLKSSNRKRNLGCSVHAGTNGLTIKKITINDVASNKEFKYVKGAFIVHGHNNEPIDINIDTLHVKSSDRHGIYLTGENINIKYAKVDAFGLGSSEDMAPMEGGINGEQGEFSGLWIKNTHNSRIQKAVINIQNSKGSYSTNFDIGDEYLPFDIDTLIIKGKNSKITRQQLEYTAVKVDKIFTE